MSRICTKCGETKPFDQFYTTAPRRCKACVKARIAAHRARNIEKIRAHDRERSKHDANRVAKHRIRTSEWRRLNKDKDSAQQKARYAKRKQPESCEGCGVQAQRLERHHHDYSKPLDIQWLCKPCHTRADQERRVA